ncbi:MAG: AAA family ATPase [Terriglobia bacterium]
MPALREDQSLARAVSPPPSRVVRRAVLDYMERSNMVAADLAAEIGRSRAGVDHFLKGRYQLLYKNDLYLRAHLWGFLQTHPLADDEQIPTKLLRTHDTRLIIGLAEEARRKNRVVIIEGPPGTSKTTALRWYEAERNRLHKHDVFYVRATTRITGKALIQQFCRKLGAHAWGTRDRLLNNLVRRIKGRPNTALLVDEAQHLLYDDAHALEQFRDVADLAGCGCVLAGHFSFIRALSDGLGRDHEQTLSRFDLHEHLRGLDKNELDLIAREFLGQELPRDVKDHLIKFALARDRNAFQRSALLPPGAKRLPVRYLSIRRVRKFFERVEELRAMPENKSQPLEAIARAGLKLLLAPAGTAL